MRIDVKKLSPNAIIPKQAHLFDAGCDLYACIDNESGTVTIDPHSTKMIGTGLAMRVPAGWGGFIYARSGLATKHGLRPANCVGVIDSGYRNEWIVAVHNDSDEPKEVLHGDRIAQMVLHPIASLDFYEVDKLDETERGMGGFGSTGR